jgi:hypothetical protein
VQKTPQSIVQDRDIPSQANAGRLRLALPWLSPPLCAAGSPLNSLSKDQSPSLTDSFTISCVRKNFGIIPVTHVTISVTFLADTPDSGQLKRYPCRRGGRTEQSDDGYLALLRASCQRPRCRAAEQRDELAPPHSITSSARASTVGGNSRSSAFAVLRLMTSSYLVGACTGRSAGFSPLRMRST